MMMSSGGGGLVIRSAYSSYLSNPTLKVERLSELLEVTKKTHQEETKRVRVFCCSFTFGWCGSTTKYFKDDDLQQ